MGFPSDQKTAEQLPVYASHRTTGEDGAPSSALIDFQTERRQRRRRLHLRCAVFLVAAYVCVSHFLNKSPHYEEAIFHVSIVWAVHANAEKLTFTLICKLAG